MKFFQPLMNLNALREQNEKISLTPDLLSGIPVLKPAERN
jgi:hypothetical protein